jgi:hypothetical protein
MSSGVGPVISLVTSIDAPIQRTAGDEPRTHDDRPRWLALVVLCVGMLMIILDTTIVNVALPAIQDDLGLLAVEPRLGRQRVPDRLRRPAPARRPARRPHRPPAMFLAA